MSKPKRMETWQKEAKDERTQAETDKKAAEDAAKKLKKDMENYSYQIRHEGRVVDEVKNEQQAVRIAKEIGARVILCIEGSGLYQIYP